MKIIQYILATIALFMFANATAFSKNDKQEVKNDTVIYTMPMHGAHCEMLIMKNMPYEKGVSKVKVDTNKQIATIIYKPGKASKESLVKAFNKLGYNPREVKDTLSEGNNKLIHK